MSIIEDDKQDKAELSFGFSFVFKSLVQIGLRAAGLKSQKVKADYSSWDSQLRTMGCHQSIWCHTILLAARYKRAHPALLDLPTPKGWKAELT